VGKMLVENDKISEISVLNDDNNKSSDVFETKINESKNRVENLKTDNLAKKRGRPRKYNAYFSII